MHILEKHPAGISEFQLIQELERRGYREFARENHSTDLTLFQSHFFLFHILYHLRDHLIEKRCSLLSIHCLKIILEPFIVELSNETVIPADPMREYYLDLNRLEGIDEQQVRQMLDNFWKRYFCNDKRKEALSILGLEEAHDPGEIKEQYRRLAHQHHPDHGGDPERFRQINEAMEILKECRG